MKKRLLFGIILLVMVYLYPGNVFGDEYAKKRDKMVSAQIEARGVRDPRTLEAMRKVPRHLFVPEYYRGMAYIDSPLSIGYGQTISQPYIVAYMTDALELSPDDKVLEIGTGSGYQAAVLAEMVEEVYTIEIVKPLYVKAKKTLEKMGYKNIHVRYGDGYKGWPEEAPFDAIIITAAPPELPQELIKQLKDGGRMILPVGRGYQRLYLITKKGKGVSEKELIPVRFVPMVQGKK